jgi:succinyl-diaminopimelate desuccinylase
MNTDLSDRIGHWVDEHFPQQVKFLQKLIRQSTDTPPGNNTPHALLSAELLTQLGFDVERHEVPPDLVRARGLQSITNLIVRRRYTQDGPTVALSVHGDAPPPGDGWTHDPYGATIKNGYLFGRGAAVSKSDFATYVYAVLALEASGIPLRGAIEIHFTYDEEFGGELGPGWLLAQGLTHPDLAICAGFSYNVVTAHNACLQLAVTVHGRAAHGAMPETGCDALQAALAIAQALYAGIPALSAIRSRVPGIGHPTLVIGRMEAGAHTNIVPGKAELKLDRRMIPEEDCAEVERQLRHTIESAVAHLPGIRIDIRRLLLAQALRPLAGHEILRDTLVRHASAVFGAPITTDGSPLYTDARLYGEYGVPAVLYGAGPRTVVESGAKQADEKLLLGDLLCATKVVALALSDLLGPASGNESIHNRL